MRLHSRSIENCNEFREIPKLPQSMAVLGLFSWGSIKNINYTKFKTKENLNILTLHKKKKNQKKKSKPKYIRFHILKSLHNIFIINLMIYISFSIHSQAIILSTGLLFD